MKIGEVAIDAIGHPGSDEVNSTHCRFTGMIT
jgi:hypothetical protein